MLIGDLAHQNQNGELSKVVPFNLLEKKKLGGPNFSSGWCMVETRAQAMANERMDKLEESV